METAKDIDGLVRGVAECLSMGSEVRFDPETLQYGAMYEPDIIGYGDYLEEGILEDGDDLKDWEIEVIKDLRDISSLPCSIDPPMKWIQYDWMVEFANGQSLGMRFPRDVQHSLDSRHPFRNFRDVMYRWGIEKEWFAYQQKLYEEYVRHELQQYL